jgi:hypothetical protein
MRGGLRLPSNPARQARWDADDAERERSHQEHVARRAALAQSWAQYYRDLRAYRREQALRRRAKSIETAAAAEIERLAYRIAATKKFADENLAAMTKRAESEIARVAKTAETTRNDLTAIAKAMLSESVAKSTSRGYRQVPVRDPETQRILYVENVPL